MKMMIMKFMFMNSTLMILVKTPMAMGAILLFQTTLTSILMNKTMKSSWIMMITFLMMIGGLMVLFSYMTSITSNKKFKMNLKITMVMLMSLLMTEELIFDIQPKEDLIMNKMENNEIMSMINLYNSKSMLLTILMVMFLLLTMISITKMVKHHKGPLRKKT
uniref:NADH dehydrogenase subunit 6 n=1 Tax=Balala fujiana TaxID=2800226 RepID=A0A7T6YDC2_9HEMI|nr:NADH dehydrogenase subunit 6 [Balala fujiana]QQK57699.1 NADH dehydrogenase subunit 6 [Balala fujiana]